MDFRCAITIRNHNSKPETVLATYRDGDLEEIFITIITDVSPSTTKNRNSEPETILASW
jgi:hypothetical protein